MLANEVCNDFEIKIDEINIKLSDCQISDIYKNLVFLENISKKPINIKVIDDKGFYKMKLFFDIDGCDCKCDTGASEFKDCLFRVKSKSKKIIASEQRRLYNAESIRMTPLKIDVPKRVKEFKYKYVDSLDKPAREKDVKNFMLEEKIDLIVFENLDKENSLCIMKKDKGEFELYITDYQFC
jgi:hypothetical protein